MAYEGIELIAACRDSAKLISGFDGQTRVGDLREPDYAEQVLKGVDVVCHCMAWTSLVGQAERSRAWYREPTLNLIEQARRQGVSRFVNVSTTAAASPSTAADAHSAGVPQDFWPHLSSVVAIEERLRAEDLGSMTRVNLRLGLFAGTRYALGLLPVLVPRLKTHLVPWVAGGRTHLPIIDGADIGQALALAATEPSLRDYAAFNVAGPTQPTVRELIAFLHQGYGLPMPHFSVPFALAYPFAALMEALDALLPWQPLVTRSIIHLLEEVGVDNREAEAILGYHPSVPWQQAVATQMQEMLRSEGAPMCLHAPT